MSEDAGFELGLVRVGVPLSSEGGDISLSSHTLDRLGEIPPVILKKLDLFYVTGKGVNAKHLSGLLRMTCGVEMGAGLIESYLVREGARLGHERERYLEQQYAADLANEMELAGDGVSSRYAATAEDLGLLLDGLVKAQVTEGSEGRLLEPNELGELVRIFKVLTEADPTYVRIERKRRKKQLDDEKHLELQKRVRTVVGTLQDYTGSKSSKMASLDDQFMPVTDAILEEQDGPEGAVAEGVQGDEGADRGDVPEREGGAREPA